MEHQIISKLFFVSILLSIACFSSQEVEQFTDYAVPDYNLCVADSFGVEFGDSLHMIGSIDDFCFHPNGSILILDRAALCVRVIPSDGEPFFISREGEAPGELLFPQSMCAQQDGTILVADEMKRKVLAFNPSGSFQGNYFATDRYVPYRMYSVDSASVVGSMLDLQMGDPIFFSFYIGRFDEDSIPSVRYTTLQWEWPAPELYTDIELIDFVAGAKGYVYYTQDNTSYLISVFSPEGEEVALIVNPEVSRISKTPKEIEEEIEYFESWARQDQAYTGGYEPSPYHQLISLIGVDAEGNLWVERHGNEDGHHFDAWDDSGNLVFTTTFSGYNEIDFLFTVDQYGMLAAVVDSEHYPRIFKLELEVSAEVIE